MKHTLLFLKMWYIARAVLHYVGPYCTVSYLTNYIRIYIFVGGSYAYDFPSMIGVSLHSADAIIIVFSVDELESFEEARRLR